MSDSAVNVVVSSRVRLARNYFDLPFLNWNRPENARLCIERAQAALCGGEENYDLYLMRDLPDVERLKLVEKHLISRDLVERAETGAALIRQDRRVSVMINEEDHLRIQAIGSGLDLETAANVAFSAWKDVWRRYAPSASIPSWGILPPAPPTPARACVPPSCCICPC